MADRTYDSFFPQPGDRTYASFFPQPGDRTYASFFPAQARGMPMPAAPAVPPQPQPSGNGNLVTSALGSGAYGAAADLGDFARAVGMRLGMPGGFTKSAADFAASQRATAATYATPENENASVFSPRGLAYRVLQGAPAVAGGLAAGLGAEALGAGALGAAGVGALTGYPLFVGQNVHEAESIPGRTQPLSQGEASKALELGVPEAALGALPLERVLSRGVSTTIGKAAMHQAATQAAVSAGQDYIAGQMGDPNRTMFQRMQSMLDAAVTGGATGGIMGAGMRALQRTPNPSNEDLSSAVDEATGQQPIAGLLPPPAIHAPGEVAQPAAPDMTQMTPEELWDHAKGLKLRGEDLSDVAAEFRNRGFWADQTPNRLLPNPVREGYSDISNAPPEAPVAQPGQVLTAPDNSVLPQGGPPLALPAPDINSARPLATLDDGTLGRLGVEAAQAPEGVTSLGHPSWQVNDEISHRAAEHEALQQELELSNRSDAIDAFKRTPQSLKTDLAANPEQAEDIVRAKIGDAEPGQPIKKSLLEAARAFGVADDDGNFVARKQPIEPAPVEPAAAPVEAPAPAAAPPAEAALNRPERDAVPPQHQARWDRAEEMRQELPEGAPADVKKTIIGTLDDVQTKLASGLKAGEHKTVDATLKRVGDIVDNQQKLTDLQAERGETPPPAPPAPPPAEPVAPSPAAQKAVNDIPALQRKPIVDAMAQVKQTRDAMADMKGAPDTMKRPGGVNKAFQDGLVEQKAALNKLVASVRRGEPIPKGLVIEAPSWDENFERFSPEAQAAIAAHQNAVETWVDRMRPVTWGDTAFKAPPGAPSSRTQGDVDAEHLIAAGASGKDLIDHFRVNGSTPDVRVTMAHLQRAGVDPSVELGQAPFGKASPLGSFDRAGYFPGSDRVQINSRSDMEQLLTHELVHAGTVKALARNGPGSRDMKALFDEAGRRAGPVDTNTNKWYGMKNVEEFVANAFTPESPLRDWLRNQPAAEGTNLWEKFKSAVAKLLGFAPGPKTMLDQVIETGHRIMRENAQTARTPTQVDSYAMRSFAKPVDDSLEKVRTIGDDVKVGTQKALLPFRNATDIAMALTNRFGIKSAGKYVASLRRTEARQNTWAKSNLSALKQFNALSEHERTQFAQVADATRVGIDARKAVGDLPLAIRNDPVRMKVYNEARKAYMGMNAGRAAYEASVAMNQGHRAYMLAQALQNYVQSLRLGAKGLTSGFENDLAAEHQFNDTAHADPAVTRDIGFRELSKRIAGLTDFTNTAKGANVGDETRNGLNMMAGIAAGELKSLQSGVPYFRAGREGDFFVAGHLPVGKDGLPEQAAIDKLRPILDAKGFKDLALNRLLENPTLYARVETAEQAQRLHDAFVAAKKQGILDPTQDISKGLAEQMPRGARPALLNEVIKAMEENAPDTDGLSAEEAQRVEDVHRRNVTELTRQLMDVLPNASQAKVSAPRKDVQLYTKDIGVGLTQGAQAYSRLLANMSTTNEKGDALGAMRNEMKALKKSEGVSVVQTQLAQNALGEMLKRDAERPVGAPNGFISGVKRLTYLFELASPGYALVLLSQNATLGLPELGSRVGYVKAGVAMARAFMPSMRALKGMMSSPDWTSAGMRLDALIKGGLSPSDAKFLARMDNLGKMTSAGYTHMLMGAPEEGAGARERLARMSTAWTRYWELQPRVQVALAAKRAWRGEARDGPLDDFAAKVIDQSQFNYDEATMPRIQSRAGPLGEMAPLMTTFWRFRTEMTHKLYREFENGFFDTGEGKGWGDADRQRSRSFLYGHLTAMTMLAGTLGLPMVGVLASVADKLADWATNDPTHDLIASYRSHLTDVFGPAMGEALARGAPRLADVDFSNLGEGKVAPGISEALMALTEKRKFEDAEKDWLKNLAGAPIGTLSNMALGVRDLANGDYMRALIKMAPEGLRGPLEAAQLERYGYRDKTGFPMRLNGQVLTPGAQDIVMQAFGIDPAKEEEANETQRVASGLANRQSLQSANITQHLMLARNRGDDQTFNDWAGWATQFSQDHPGVAPPIADFARVMQMHAMQSAFGIGGVRPNNLVARGMTGFANPHQ